MRGARDNRGAGVGVFVFSKRTLGSEIPPLSRHGNDVVVVWDSEDPGSDPYLDGGLSITKALSARQGSRRGGGPGSRGDGKGDIGGRTAGKWTGEDRQVANTIQSGGENILERVTIMCAGLKRQTDILHERLGALREVVGGEA